MATFTFTIPPDKLTRIGNAIVTEGYVFNPALGTTDSQQKIAFTKKITMDYWRSIVFNFERQEAIKLEPNDTAAEQAKRWDGMTDLSAN